MCGIDTSSNTRAGLFLRAISSACSPSCAMSHSKLKCLSIVESITIVVASSSANTTRRDPLGAALWSTTSAVSTNLRTRCVLSNNSSGLHGRKMNSRLRSKTAAKPVTRSSNEPMITAGFRLRAIISIGAGPSPEPAAEALMKHASNGAKELSPGMSGCAPITCPIPRALPNVAMIESVSAASKPIKPNLLPAKDCRMNWSMTDASPLRRENVGIGQPDGGKTDSASCD